MQRLQLNQGLKVSTILLELVHLGRNLTEINQPNPGSRNPMCLCLCRSRINTYITDKFRNVYCDQRVIFHVDVAGKEKVSFKIHAKFVLYDKLTSARLLVSWQFQTKTVLCLMSMWQNEPLPNSVESLLNLVLRHDYHLSPGTDAINRSILTNHMMVMYYNLYLYTHMITYQKCK